MSADSKAKSEAMAKACGILSEHFDHAIILACVNPKDFTGPQPGFRWQGLGNWYAQKGMLSERLEHMTHQTIANEIGEQFNGPDDTEAWQKGEGA